MREILFRGKTKKGEWVNGYLTKSYFGSPYKSIWTIEVEEVTAIYKQGTEYTMQPYEVIPETVGQYTGLTDKRYKKIFEGDILKFDNMGIYPVWWDADFYTFGSCWFSDFDPLYKYDQRKIEVIGNIHDNPKMLKGE